MQRKSKTSCLQDSTGHIWKVVTVDPTSPSICRYKRQAKLRLIQRERERGLFSSMHPNAPEDPNDALFFYFIYYYFLNNLRPPSDLTLTPRLRTTALADSDLTTLLVSTGSRIPQE